MGNTVNIKMIKDSRNPGLLSRIDVNRAKDIIEFIQTVLEHKMQGEVGTLRDTEAWEISQSSGPSPHPAKDF